MIVALVSGLCEPLARYRGADRILRRLPLARSQDAVGRHPFPGCCGPRGP